MPAPFEIDIETLLQPISDQEPAGVLLRYEGTYDKIREARREDDPTLPQGVWEKPLKTADWGAVHTLCTDALARRSKDLQIAVWLAEAWVKHAGVAGATQGEKLLLGLCEGFWDTMFPELTAGTEARANLFDWIDDVVASVLRRLPITEPTSTSPAYTAADWEAGLPNAGAPSARAGRGGEEPAEVTRESFLAKLSLTKYARWSEHQRAIEEATASALALEKALEGRIDQPAVLRRTRAVLRTMASIVEQGLHATKDQAPLTASPSAPAAAGGGEPSSSDAAHQIASIGAPIRSRSEAYLRLTEAADYLLRTEPHSPVPYLVKRAISWGNMSLAELLYEFIGTTDDLVAIQRLLGMREKE
jgi:type VI secretion system protein ImpA